MKKIFYSNENGQTKVEVILQDDNVWLNVNAIAALFDVQRPAIVKHINNIYNDEELSKESTLTNVMFTKLNYYVNL